MENNDMILTEQETEASGSLEAEGSENEVTGAISDSAGGSGTAESERSEYRRLIRTRFKDYFTEDVEKIINRRVRRYKSELERLQSGEEAEVAEADTTAEDAQRERIDRDGVIGLIRAAGSELESRYSSFSLADAERDERFISLATVGIDSGAFGIEDAYKLSNFDSIIASERELTRRETEEKVLQSAAIRRMRPDENGIRASRGYGSFDASKLSRGERAEIARRAAKGEKISF
jgi:hypothetical protein